MDRDLYRRQFHLNENEVELISTSSPSSNSSLRRRNWRRSPISTVDPKSYWLYTNDPFDNRKRREAFETYGFEKGLEMLAGGQP